MVKSGNDFGTERQLVGRKIQCLACDVFRETINLEENVPRFDDRNVVFDIPLPRSHGNFRTLFGDWHVGKRTNPNFSTTLQVARHCAARCLDLPSGELSSRERL